MNRIKLIKKAAAWAEKKGLMKVKANHLEFEMPKKFKAAQFEKPITPDVTGMQAGGKFYIEVATKTDYIRRRVSKWQLLSKLAQIKGGKLLLLAPHGHKAFVKRILNDYKINAKLIDWRTVS